VAIMTNQQMDELEKLAMPIQEWLKENSNPHAKVEVSILGVGMSELLFDITNKNID